MHKRFVATIVVGALVAGSIVAAWAAAKSGTSPTHGASAEQQMPACCQQMMQSMQKGQTNMNMANMMQEMTPEMMERMQLLMRTPIFLDAPCPIFAQAEKLALSEEQKKKLGEIENEARAKARAVLTPEQQAKLGDVPDKPVMMMETCPMMKMMEQNKGTTGKMPMAGGNKAK